MTLQILQKSATNEKYFITEVETSNFWGVKKTYKIKFILYKDTTESKLEQYAEQVIDNKDEWRGGKDGTFNYASSWGRAVVANEAGAFPTRKK